MTVANAKRRAARMIASHESFVEHMYLDSRSYVTVGYGKMMPDAAAAVPISFTNVTTTPNRPATDQEKEAEWRRMQAISPQGTDINYVASHYEQFRTLEITQAEGTRLLESELNNALAILYSNYPDFRAFPEEAQIAMIDMAYNLGNRIHTVFRMFTRAINKSGGPDWEEAANQSNRPQLSRSRNREIFDLFMSAHRQSQSTRSNP